MTVTAVWVTQAKGIELSPREGRQGKGGGLHLWSSSGQEPYCKAVSPPHPVTRGGESGWEQPQEARPGCMRMRGWI